MAQIVGGFLVPHDPMILGSPGAAPETSRRRVAEAFEVIKSRLEMLEATTTVVIGDDHYALFGPHCVPRCLIGIGDVDGPLEPWLGIPRRAIPNNESLARHIMQTGFDEGIDWSFAKSLTVDHSIAVPMHLCLGFNPDMRIVPVYLNCGVPPVISSRRAHQIGSSIRRAISTFPGDDRVVILGTGGISHWVGAAEMGKVNESFDLEILQAIERGDADSLIARSDGDVLAQGGNGALEIKNWICAMGALGKLRADVVAYEPVPEWISGLGFAELHAAQ